MIDTQALSALSGVLTSLAFGYIPGLREWFGALTTERKRLFMAAVLLLAAVGMYGAGCGDLFGVTVECSQSGLIGVLEAFLVALVANQSAYTIGVRNVAPGSISAETE